MQFTFSLKCGLKIKEKYCLSSNVDATYTDIENHISSLENLIVEIGRYKHNIYS